MHDEVPIRDGQEVHAVHANGQHWRVTWHGPEAVPDGRRHGSAGICIAPDGRAVIVSVDGTRWDLPAGRPEGTEDWEATLRREVQEEACATVTAARLLGFSRGRCVKGHEAGLVLVRAIWRAEVRVEPWQPRFEMRHRRLVPAADLVNQLVIEGDADYRSTFQRAMIEAGLT
ncbi:MAG: NUDIX domain-containing protein [Phycisphaeraceae bacterium]